MLNYRNKRECVTFIHLHFLQGKPVFHALERWELVHVKLRRLLRGELEIRAETCSHCEGFLHWLFAGIKMGFSTDLRGKDTSNLNIEINGLHVLYMRFCQMFFVIRVFVPGREAEEGVSLLIKLLSFFMNSSLGLMERWEMIDAASWKKVEYAIFMSTMA